ncbi:DNA/RNA polymerase [Lactarius psammicola]|nr:DNA/RNA polymerase [Lactarius psammicola]
MFPTSPLKHASRKEKSKFTPQAEFTDLDLPITYRHFLFPPSGARDPLRVIALCDSDAFYAACEQVRLGIDPSRPLVVRQWDALIAVNYPARAFGITRMSNWRDALKKCPELIVVHVATYKEGDKAPGYCDNPDTATHKVSLDYYRRESAKIISIFKEGLPDGEIEKASIDEAFIDFTHPVRAELLARYPYLSQVPPDAPHGLDTALPPPPRISLADHGILIPVDPPPGDTDSTPTIGKDVEEDEPRTWHDVALSIAAELMDKIRADVRTQLGYTTSAGIARNKFLAKLAASYKKRDSQSILRNAAIPNYLIPMPFQKIRFLGGKLGQAIADKFEASTVGDLLALIHPWLDEMQQKFGEDSIWVYEILRGIDRNEVKEKSAMTKSMMASKNLPHPITKFSEGPHWLRVLAAELALRLNEAREADPSVWPKTIVLHARARQEGSRSKQTSFPFARTVTVDTIVGFAERLWKDLVGSGNKQDGSLPYSITHVALGFSGVEPGEAGQQSIEGFFQPGTITGDPLPADRKRRRVAVEDSASASVDLSGTSQIDRGEKAMMAFVCPRCYRRIELEPTDDPHTDGEAGEALSRLRIEHSDFHLAEDLSKMAGGGDGDVGGGSVRIRAVEKVKNTKTKRKKQPPEDGIAKFFARK